MAEGNWAAVTRSHRGNWRQYNEDAVVVHPSAPLWAVADGMGGHEAGDVASQAIADALSDPLVPEHSLSERVDWIEDRLLAVDQQLHRQAQRIGPDAVVGATVVSLTVARHVGVVLWAGDSRLYRCRDGQLQVVTRDHNPIADLLDFGAISEAEALAADTNVVTRAVGGQRRLALDVVAFDVQPGDRLLLCTDGLYRELEAAELSDLLHQQPLQLAADALMARVLGRAARDNLSLVLVEQSRADHD